MQFRHGSTGPFVVEKHSPTELKLSCGNDRHTVIGFIKWLPANTLNGKGYWLGSIFDVCELGRWTSLTEAFDIVCPALLARWTITNNMQQSNDAAEDVINRLFQAGAEAIGELPARGIMQHEQLFRYPATNKKGDAYV